MFREIPEYSRFVANLTTFIFYTKCIPDRQRLKSASMYDCSIIMLRLPVSPSAAWLFKDDG